MKITVSEIVSSNMNGIMYESKRKELVMFFNNDTKYLYSEVPLTTVIGFLASESKGKYFHTHIKNSYSYVKVK